jgi:tetratricopeptide (TPR) repeat protein
LTRLGRHADAVADWRRALELDSGSNRNFLHFNLAYALIRSGDHAGAVAEAEKLEKSQPATGNLLYNLASVYSRAAAAVAGDASLPESTRKQRVEQYASRAVALLSRGAQGGMFRNPANLERLRKDIDVNKDSDLAPLRDRADFKKLLADVERPAASSSP